MLYRHVQELTPMRLGALGCLVAIVLTVAAGGAGWVAFTLAIVAVALVAVSRLTVVVEPSTVVAAFGLGWPRRTVRLADVVGVRAVRNAWWVGLGIRRIRHGSMFNNAGRDAVELGLADGRVFRIGTDEPDALTAALGRVID